MNRLQKSALWYARHGWFVVPLHNPLFADGVCIGCTCESYYRTKRGADYVCRTPGKHPRIAGWEDNASNDADEINGWWRRWPHANVGIAAGKSGLLCFDVDSYKDDYEGEQLLSAADEETVTNLSGGGGQHLIYRMPEGAHYSNANSKLPDGIDIRGWGGQFVAPPSVHPSGNVYRWEDGYGPHERAPLELPDHVKEVLDRAQPRFTTQAQFTNETPDRPEIRNWRISKRIHGLIMSPAQKGARSEADQSVITALVRQGATDQEILGVFVHYPIGEGKFSEKGANALQYLAHSIGHARAYCAQDVINTVAQRVAGELR